MNAPVRTPKATNLSLDAALLAEARSLGVNVSRACEKGLEAEVKRARAERWLEENRATLQSWNDYVDKNGLPLEHLRLF